MWERCTWVKYCQHRKGGRSLILLENKWKPGVAGLWHTFVLVIFPLIRSTKAIRPYLSLLDSHQLMGISSKFKFTMRDRCRICFEQGLQGSSIVFLYLYKNYPKNSWGFTVRKCLGQGRCYQVWTDVLIPGNSVCLPPRFRCYWRKALCFHSWSVGPKRGVLTWGMVIKRFGLLFCCRLCK